MELIHGAGSILLKYCNPLITTVEAKPNASVKEKVIPYYLVVKAMSHPPPDSYSLFHQLHLSLSLYLKMAYMHRAHDEVKRKLSYKEVNTNWQVSPRLHGMAHVTDLVPRKGSDQERTDVKGMLESIGGGAEEQVCVWGGAEG